MAARQAFKPSDLAREIALRGLSQTQFAESAGVDAETLSRALKGKRLQTKTFGKILLALGEERREITA